MTADPRPAARPPARAAHLLPFVVPALCCALAIAFRPAGRLGPPDASPWLDQILYDDNDLGAMALRGLNARLGRDAGRREPPRQLTSEEYAEALRTPRPREPRYYLEYPHAALLLFELPYLLEPVSPTVPAPLLDGDYQNMVYHRPRGDEEAALWGRFHRVVTAYGMMMVASYAGLVAVLAVGYLPGGGLGYRGLLLILPGTLFFSLNRFDVVPALLTALSLASLGRGRLTASALLLAAGTLVKVFPLFLAPFVVRHLLTARTRRAAGCWVAAYAAGLAAFLWPAVGVWGAEAVAAPYRVQLSRQREGFTAYDYFIPGAALRDELSGNGPVGRGFRFGALALVAGLLLVRPIPELAGVLRRGAVVLVVFMCLSVFYSPQWVLWLTPLLLPLAGRQSRIVPLAAALDLLTWAQWPVAFNVVQLLGLDKPPLAPDGTPVLGLSLYAGDVLLGVLSYARFAVLGLIVWGVLRADRAPAPEPSPAEPSPAVA